MHILIFIAFLFIGNSFGQFGRNKPAQEMFIFLYSNIQDSHAPPSV